MKKIITVALSLAFGHQLFAQWDNPTPGVFSTYNKVGIGTTTPSTMLHINGNGYAAIAMGNDDATGFVLTKESANNSFNIWSAPFGTSASINRFSISHDGNVGINNFSPVYKLDVGASRPNDGVRLTYNNTGWLALQPNTLTQSAYNLITQAGDAGITFGNLGVPNPTTSFGFVITPWLNSMSGLRIDAQGNVGVCTWTTQGYKFAVNGDAIFTKVVVKPYSSWPDYVFDSAYKLPSLEILNRYIKDNHHLPEIPSADSVAKTGIDVGASQTALLKKIEELTLYMIQVNETVKQQQEKISRLEGLLEARPPRQATANSCRPNPDPYKVR